MFKSSTPTEKIILTPSGKLAYLDPDKQSKHNKPIIIMLHGNSNSKEMFKSLYLLLTDYRCIAIDLLGHGNSDAANSSGDYDYQSQATAVAQFLETLELTEVHILGLSLGGHIGYELLTNDRVDSVVSLGAPPIAKVIHDGSETYDLPNWFSFSEHDNNNNEEEIDGITSEFDIMTLMQKSEFTQSEAEFWIAGAGITENVPEYESQLNAALRTKPNARPGLFKACMAAQGGDHNKLILETDKKVCLILGEHDHIDAKKVQAFSDNAGDHVTHRVVKNGAHYALYGKSKNNFIKTLKEVMDSHLAPEKVITPRKC